MQYALHTSHQQPTDHLRCAARGAAKPLRFCSTSLMVPGSHSKLSFAPGRAAACLVGNPPCSTRTYSNGKSLVYRLQQDFFGKRNALSLRLLDRKRSTQPADSPNLQVPRRWNPPGPANISTCHAGRTMSVHQAPLLDSTHQHTVTPCDTQSHWYLSNIPVEYLSNWVEHQSTFRNDTLPTPEVSYFALLLQDDFRCT